MDKSVTFASTVLFTVDVSSENVSHILLKRISICDGSLDNCFTEMASHQAQRLTYSRGIVSDVSDNRREETNLALCSQGHRIVIVFNPFSNLFVTL